MKRFRWPLRRLLDVTLQRERAMRARLFGLSRQIAAVHREIFLHQASLRSALAELARRAIRKRLGEQQIFMRCSVAQEAQLDRLRDQIKALQSRRSEEMAAFTKTRSSRETLERLRAEALQRHTRQMIRQEQKQLDESSQAAFARELIRRRVGKAG